MIVKRTNNSLYLLTTRLFQTLHPDIRLSANWKQGQSGSYAARLAQVRVQDQNAWWSNQRVHQGQHAWLLPQSPSTAKLFRLWRLPTSIHWELFWGGWINVIKFLLKRTDLTHFAFGCRIRCQITRYPLRLCVVGFPRTWWRTRDHE